MSANILPPIRPKSPAETRQLGTFDKSIKGYCDHVKIAEATVRESKRVPDFDVSCGFIDGTLDGTVRVLRSYVSANWGASDGSKTRSQVLRAHVPESGFGEVLDSAREDYDTFYCNDEKRQDLLKVTWPWPFKKEGTTPPPERRRLSN